MQNQLSFLLGTLQNYQFNIYGCVEFNYKGNRFDPIQQVYAKFVSSDLSEINQILTTFNIYINNNLVFFGTIDKQIISPIGYQYYLEIYASTKAKILVQNKVIPRMLYRLSSQTLNDKYILPFLKGNRFPFDTTINFINVPMGTSYWDIIDVFCKIMYDSPAFLDRDGYISTNPFNDVIHSFSNYHPDSIKFNNIEFVSSTENLISDLYLKTHEDNDGPVFDIYKENPLKHQFNLNIVKYFDPPIAWAKSYDKYFKYFFQQDNRQIELIKLKIVDLININLGDLANLHYDDIIIQNLYVYSIDTQFKYNKYTTFVTLAYQKYLT